MTDVKMTEVQRLKLENINLKLAAMEREKEALLAERAALLDAGRKAAPVKVRKGGWPKGKKRGPKAKPAEDHTNGAVQEAAQ